MAEENKAHLLKYTGQGLNSILDRADSVIKTAQDNVKYYINPFNGGIGPEVPEGNSVLLGGDDKKINTVSSKPGAFYSSIEGRAPQFGTLPVQYGGTGVTTYSDLKKILGLGENTTGALKVENGGTGITNPTPNKILATTSGAYVYISPSDAGTILVSNGSDKLPTFETIKSISATTDFGTINTGEWKGSIISVEHGGTGVTNLDDLSNNLGLSITNSPIGVSRGGTGVKNLNDLKKNLAIRFIDINMENSIISESNGGTGYNTLNEALKNSSAITKHNFNNFIISPITELIDSQFIGTEAKYIELTESNCGTMISVKATFPTTLKLPILPIDFKNSYEIEILRFTSQDVYIESPEGSNCYFVGAENPCTTVKISEQYSSIGVKRISDGWLITGGVEAAV